MTLWELVKKAHGTLTVWYSYLVGASVLLQETWAQMDDYIPVRARHVVLGIATALVFLDKVRRSAKPPP